MKALGPFRLSLRNNGFLHLDGGAMFGTVPKVMWEKWMAPDGENRIPLATWSLLVDAGERRFMVDVGTGAHWPEKLRRIYAVESRPDAEDGFDPGSVTDVVISHLHFDHAGGLFARKPGTEGDIELRFPKAKIYVQAAHLENARHPNPHERMSFLRKTLTALDRSNLVLTEGSEEIFPGIRVHRSDGHTRGLQWVEVRGGGTAVAFPSDMIPFSHHVALPYTMGYDINVEKLLAEKEDFLNRALAGDWTVVFEHDPDVAAARLKRDDKGRIAVSSFVNL
ncbi:MAG: MBL fold metallo-hydrolase [Candidatus Aminicenantes bacterium]|nr:MBL fold metallo-hydrolase [Candidatus Aminicenantes bacterium]